MVKLTSLRSIIILFSHLLHLCAFLYCLEYLMAHKGGVSEVVAEGGINPMSPVFNSFDPQDNTLNFIIFSLKKLFYIESSKFIPYKVLFCPLRVSKFHIFKWYPSRVIINLIYQSSKCRYVIACERKIQRIASSKREIVSNRK